MNLFAVMLVNQVIPANKVFHPEVQEPDEAPISRVLFYGFSAIATVVVLALSGRSN
jgi:hypothetical protein